MKTLAELLRHPQYQQAMATLEKGDAVKALSFLEATVREEPGHYVAWNNIGFLLYQAKYLKEAENAFLKACSLEPSYGDARSNLFQLYIAAKETARAREQYDMLRRHSPTHDDLAGMEKELAGVAPAVSVSVGNALPLVSIVLATYNRPKLLPVAIESVLRQTYRNLEVVVVNDGGCDVSDVVARFNDPRLKYIAKPANMGAGNSYNTAIYESAGPYIGYLADDDLYYPNHVETLVSVLEKNPRLGGAYSDQYRVDCEMNDGVYTKILGRWIDYSVNFDKIALIARTNFIPHPCLIHRRGLLRQCGYFDESLPALIDYDFLRRMAFFTDFIHVPVITGEYFFVKNKMERLSNLFDTDPERYQKTLHTVMSKRPAGSWDRLKEIDFLIFCRTFGSRPLEPLKTILTYFQYPANLLMVFDEYDKAALDTVRSFKIPNLEAQFNIKPCGIAETVRKLLNSRLSDSWFFAIDESVALNDDWLNGLFNSLYAAHRGTLCQPERFQVNALYTNPWNIRF